MSKQFELYNGTIVLDFDEKRHIYTHASTGVVVPSVTKITKVINNEGLLFWVASETIKKIKTQWIPRKVYTQEQIDYLLAGSRLAFKGTVALDIGTETHKWIENFINLVMETGKKWPDDWRSLETPFYDESVNAICAFLQWHNDNDVTYLSTERKVYSREYDYGGTLDIIAIVNGVRSIIDLKTSKNIYPNYYIQGASYWWAIEEEQRFCLQDPKEVGIKQFMVLRTPKDFNGTYVVGTLKSLDVCWGIFKACHEIFRWQQKFKAPRKMKGTKLNESINQFKESIL